MYLYSHYKRYIIVGIFLTIVFLVLFRFVRTSLDGGGMKVSFLDVGQGDAVLIESPNGNRLLYDGGPRGGSGEHALRKLLPMFSSVDIYVASHPDADHIGGFLEFIPRYTPTYYADSHTLHLSSLFATLEETVNSMNITRMTLRSGAQISLGGGVVVEVLAPYEETMKGDTNKASVVLLVRYGLTQVLLMGDLDIEGEHQLVKRHGKAIRADILKAGHHGSRTSSSDELLRTVSPRYVVISAGKNNSYGHPHLAAVQRMQAVQSEILETAKKGNVLFLCDGRTCVLK